MTPRNSSPVVLVAALLACKNSGPMGPEPGLPPADLQAAFDPGAIAEHPGAPPQPASGAALAVQDYAPQGRTAGGAAIKVRFNQPVVALGSEQVPSGSQWISLDPPVAGRTTFKAPDLLVFEPTEPLADATRYTVRFAPGLVGLDGQRLEQGLEWTFETPRPRCEGATAIGPDLEFEGLRRDTAFVVAFDQPTTLAEVRAHLQATARPLGRQEAKPAPVRLSVRASTAAEVERAYYYYDREDARGRYYTVRPQGLWPGDSEVRLEVTPGLRGLLGPLALDTPWEMSFQTYSPQAVVEFGCGDGQTRCGLETLGLVLRNPVKQGQARKISVRPRPKGLKVDVFDAYDDSGGTQVEIDGQFIPGTTYTVSISPDLKDIYGQGLVGGFSRTVVIERRPELELSSSEGTLLPTRASTIGVEARFVRALRVRAASLKEPELLAQPWQDMPLPAGARERIVELSPKGPGGWASVALDVADLVGGARGPVLVEVSAHALADSADREAPPPVRGLYRVSDLGPVVIDSPTRALVQVLRLSDSAPVAGATV